MTLLSVFKETTINSREAIIFVNAGGAEEHLTYQQLWQDAVQLATALQQHGLTKGCELVIQTDDNKTFLQLFWACILSGIIPVPLATGTQSTQKIKLFKIWCCLTRPYLVSETAHTARLEKVALETGMQEMFEQIQQRTIDLNNLLQDIPGSSAIPSIPINITPADIAYIQFSSGSTGDPKGVTLTHANLISNIKDIVSSMAMTTQDCLLSWMPLTHDMGMIGTHLTGLLLGVKTVLIATPVFIRKPLIWMEKITAHKATVLFSPNFGLQYILAALEQGKSYNWQLSQVRILINGAEPISAALCKQFTGTFAQYGLYKNVIVAAYGLAEASVEVTATPVHEPLRFFCLSRAALNIGDQILAVSAETGQGAWFADVGYPVSQCAVRITGDDDQVLTEDCIGHIQIKGTNVTAGYYQHPTASKTLFTADGWLRTGDVGYLHEKRLVVTGRFKNIIILNGKNYYPQDLEQVLITAGITEPGKVVACGIRDPENKREELVIFVLFKGAQETFQEIVTQIRYLLKEETGVWADQVIPVKRIPKTTSGKIQHYALVAQYQAGDFKVDDKVMYKDGNQEENIIALYRMLTGDDNAGPATSLWGNGMNSLHAMQFIAGIRQQTGVEVPVEVLFNSAVLGDICYYTANSAAAGRLPALVRMSPLLPAAMSPAQERIATECILHKDTAAYNIPVLFQIKGPLDIHALEHAWNHVLQQHEIFRMSFTWTGSNWQASVHPFVPVTLPVTENAVMETLVHAPFDLSLPGQYRLQLWKTGESAYRLLLVIHHLLTDGWSLVQLFQTLSQTYQRLLQQLPPEQDTALFQYRDYMVWQQQVYQTGDWNKELDYWKTQLEAAPEPVCFFDAQQHGVTVRPVFEQYTCCFTKAEEQLLDALGGRYGITRFGVITTLLYALLYRYTGKKDLITGIDVAGRQMAEMDKIQGYLINTLCLRIGVDETMSFAALFRQVRSQLGGAMSHQRVPYEKVLEAVGNETGLFRLLILYQQFYTETAFSLEGCTTEHLPVPVHDGFTDMVFEFTELAAGLQLRIQYNTSLATAETMERLLAHLRQTLKAAADDATLLCQYHLLLPDEITTLLQPATPITALPVHRTFESRAVATPEAPAIYTDNGIITYQELNCRANQLAALLRTTIHITPDTCIAYLLERNEQMIIVMLAILKAGAAYVALDPDYPAARCNAILQDCKAPLLLSCKSLSTRLPEVTTIVVDELPALPDNDHNPVAADLAYITYTSGSTGRPKGIMIPQEALSAYVAACSSYFEITPADIFIQQASVVFDTIVEEIFVPLCSGAAVVIAPHGGRDIPALLALISRYKATVLSTTPLVLDEINRYPADDRLSLRTIISGGDVLRSSHINRLLQTTAVYNTYGPSEATVCATYKKLETPADAAFIGQPVPGCRVYLLDEQLQLLPDEVNGELYIEGNLATGYLNDPTLTAKRFIPAPWDHTRRLFRTGDRARRTAGGDIVFTGRSDEQVKIRGHRVEPADVESMIMEHPAVQTAVVLKTPEQEYLTACIILKTPLSETVLRSYLHERLPLYMVPAVFYFPDTIPVTVTGKIDRRQLLSGLPQQTFAADIPASPREAALLAIMQEVLEINDLTRQQHFFERGANSIKAMKAVNVIRQQLQCQLEIRDLFLYPSVSLLAAVLDTPAVMEQPILPLPPAPCYVLSPEQKRLWLLHRLDSSSYAYHEGSWYELTGHLDPPLFFRALNKIIDRHDVFRTTFHEVDDMPVQQVHAAGEWPFNAVFHDLPGDTATAAAIFKDMLQQPFDLEKGPLYRILMIRTAPDHYYFSFIIHHIITDDWSATLLLEECSTIYQAMVKAEEPQLRPLLLQYRDYAAWIGNRAQLPAMAQHREYWAAVFHDEIPVLNLPQSFSRPAIKQPAGDAVLQRMNTHTFQQLKKACTKEQVSLFMYLLAGTYTLLARYTGQYDMVIGTPIAARPHIDLQQMQGFFINMLPLRITSAPEDTPDALLQQIRQLCLDGYEHADCSFDDMAGGHYRPRELSRHPLFDVIIVLNNTKDNTVFDTGADGFTGRRMLRPFSPAKYDLAFYFEEEDDTLNCTLEYDTAIYSRALMTQLLQHYLQMMEALLQQEGTALHALSYLSAEEETRLLSFNGPSVPLPEGNVVTLFRKQVQLRPDATAIICNKTAYGYAQLDHTSDQLAAYLKTTAGVLPGHRVCMLMNRSADMIIAILGILKAGAAYVPMDTGLPDARMAVIINDAAATVILTDPEHYRQLDENRAALPMVRHIMDVTALEAIPFIEADLPVACDGPAYIIYTSGSTGTPKGVIVPHRALTNLVTDMITRCDVRETHTWLAVSAYNFDMSVSEFFIPLSCGATLILTTDEEITEMQLLRDVCQHYRPDYMQATPTLWHMLIEAGWEGHAGLSTLMAGEPLPDDLRVKLLQRARCCWNMYGPTETTIYCTGTKITRSDLPITIGGPMNNTTIYIVDEHAQPVPPGVYGELMIGGTCVAEGYLNQPDLTAEKFITTAYLHQPAERLYYSGDIGKWTPSGEIEIEGRKDRQVKLRGFRIELAEIEHVIMSSGLAQNAVVLLLQDHQGDKYLLACVVFQQQAPDNEQQLKSRMMAALPAYMVPSFILALPAIPTTPNGKTDRKALQESIKEYHYREASAYVPPGTETEILLAALWSGLLDREQISIHDNFFELGGNSLKANRMVSSIYRHTGIPLKLSDVFIKATIHGLGKLINEQEQAQYTTIDI